MTPHPSGGQTILIAEDEPLIRNLIRTVLSARGYDVIDAADGQEALEISRKYSGEIDMLLTDVRMPRMNGVELSAKIQIDRPGIRVLVMSAESSGMLGELARETNFIRKPFLLNVLRDKVEEILQIFPGSA